MLGDLRTPPRPGEANRRSAHYANSTPILPLSFRMYACCQEWDYSWKSEPIAPAILLFQPQGEQSPFNFIRLQQIVSHRPLKCLRRLESLHRKQTFTPRICALLSGPPCTSCKGSVFPYFQQGGLWPSSFRQLPLRLRPV